MFFIFNDFLEIINKLSTRINQVLSLENFEEYEEEHLTKSSTLKLVKTCWIAEGE